MVQNLPYIQCGDYFIPDIRLARTETQSLGKYGRMRRIFLEQNKPILFNDMILNETLFLPLWEVQQTCVKRKELLMTDLLAKNPAPNIVILILSNLILGKENSITFLFPIVAYNPLIYRPLTL